jgi:hypothetical protein
MCSAYSKNVLGIILTLLLSAGAICAQSSSFTYQGRLADGSAPANGTYDLQFALFDSPGGNLQIGLTQTIPNVTVSEGVFTVTLDFGANAFPGASRFLEISARPIGAASFTLLSPRQPIASTPYAVRSLTAGTADNATQLDGSAASAFVKTDDARLSDPRDPKTGSSNYIQNTTSPQAAGNFNISGNGTAGGTLSGNTVNAATQYNLGGQKVLGVSSDNVLKLGNSANVGIGQTFFPSYKLEVESPDKNGLRVGTITPGGTALSIGGYGSLAVDAPGNEAGRFVVQENGNVGIGKTNPTSKLQVAGTVESTAGGFKFPDGSVQSSAANPLLGKVYSNDPNLPEVELRSGGYTDPIDTLTLPPGVYLITATVQFENRANGFLQDNTRYVKCSLINEYLWSNRLGAPGTAMDQMTVTMHTVITKGVAGPVSLSCGNWESGGQVFAKARRLTAIRVADNPQ